MREVERLSFFFLSKIEHSIIAARLRHLSCPSLALQTTTSTTHLVHPLVRLGRAAQQRVGEAPERVRRAGTAAAAAAARTRIVCRAAVAGAARRQLAERHRSVASARARALSVEEETKRKALPASA